MRHVWAVSGTAAGDSQFSPAADADLGAGVVTITDVLTLHIMGAQAANLGLSSTGSPVPK